MDVSRISAAFLSSPSPLVMEKRGAPPEETKPAKALIKEIRGKATPTPERVRVPSPGICPINILSTMLYVTLTSSAKNMGAAILNICTGTLPFEKSPFLVSIAKYSDICENYTRQVALGPLTNIAILLEKHPEVKDKIDRIIFMGTSYHCGNPSPVATFNVLVDPEAFRKVAFSGISFISCPLETVRKVLVTDEIKNKVASTDTKGGKMVSTLLSTYGITNIKSNEHIDKEGEEPISRERIESVAKKGQGLPDLMTMAYAIDPSIFQGNLYYCDVECKGELTLGMTLVDMNDYYMKKEQERNLFFLENVDKDRFLDMFYNALESY